MVKDMQLSAPVSNIFPSNELSHFNFFFLIERGKVYIKWFVFTLTVESHFNQPFNLEAGTS